MWASGHDSSLRRAQDQPGDHVQPSTLAEVASPDSRTLRAPTSSEVRTFDRGTRQHDIQQRNVGMFVGGRVGSVSEKKKFFIKNAYLFYFFIYRCKNLHNI
jgi:hypothetical protein